MASITLTVNSGGGSTGNSVSQGGVTFTVDGTYTVGNYVDGPAYIVIPSGTAQMSEPTPAQTTIGGKIVNGAMVNPQANDGQAYDEREDGSLASDNWDGANIADTWPLTVQAGDVIVKAVSADPGPTIGDWVAARAGYVEEYAACFIVASEPGANEFAPAALGWSGRGTPAGYSIDVSAKVSALAATYDTTGHDMPTYAEIMARIDHYVPCLAHFGDNPYGHRYMLPRGMGSGTDLYGRYVAGNIQAAMLALISDGFTTTQKEAIYTRLVSMGINFYDPYTGSNTEIKPNGGLYQFSFGPMAMALEATGRSSSYSAMLANQGGNQRQAFQISSAQAAQFTPHDSYSQPFTWRRRGISAINGNVITIETYRVGDDGDNTKGSFRGLTLTNGTATTTVTADQAGENIPSGSSGTYDITVASASGFSTSDTVWFTPAVMPSTGDYEWGIEGTRTFNQYNPNPAAAYRNLNEWSGLVLGLKAMGIWHSSWDAIEGYVSRANEANDPAGWDFPDHHGLFFLADGSTAQWEADFWADHAATILA